MTNIRGWTVRKMAALAMGVAALALGAIFVAPASATSGTISVMPSSGTVAAGSYFTVGIRQNASVATSGVQSDLTFDQTKLQIVSLGRGSSYPIVNGVCSPCGTMTAGIAPQTIAQAITTANSTGTLHNAAVFYATGAGEPSVPSGDQEAMVVTMQATGAVSTVSALTLTNPELIDAGGLDPVVTVVNSSVSLAASSATIAVAPLTQDVFDHPGSPFTISINQTSAVATSGAQAGLMFDPTKLQIVSIARGSGWPTPNGGCLDVCGTLTVGVAPQTVPQAITEANTTGWLKGLTVYYATGAGEPSVPAGTREAFVVTMQALTSAPVTHQAIIPVNPETVDATGTSLLDAVTPGDVLVHHDDLDGCRDDREPLLVPATDPLNRWDFYSVPVPALYGAAMPTTVFRDKAVTAGDAQAVFAYFKKNAHTGTLEYEQDLNVNGIKDGVEYDRSNAGPGVSGPPDGAVGASEAQLAFSQFKKSYVCLFGEP